MKLAVLAEQNFNLIDGSTIWLLNVCKLLALQPDFETSLILTHRRDNPVLSAELPDTIRIIEPPRLLGASCIADTRLRPEILIDALSAWEGDQGRFDRIFVRGPAYLTRLLQAPEFRDRVVAYAPGTLPDLRQPDPDWVGLARVARTPVVIQSEVGRQALETLFDYPAHVLHVVPPIVFPAGKVQGRADGLVTLCYAGKIDLHYGLDWLIDICARVAGDPGLGVCLIAGKDTHRGRHPQFFGMMDGFRARIKRGELAGISLASNLAHGAARALMGQADFAYCLRHDCYDDVIEISTKTVEFCSAGVPPILNDNALNRALFGDDYPYLIDIAADDIAARLITFMGSRHAGSYRLARRRIATIAARFSANALSGSLGRAIRGYARTAPALSTGAHRIMIATHERKFLGRFLDRIRGARDVHISWQVWKSTEKPETRPNIPADVDTVFCEWCCENAVWHSNNKRAGTRLIIRLHRFEAFRDFPGRVNWDNVDALIVVSEHFRDLMIARHRVTPAHVHVLPQYIDWHGLQRPKLREARFTLGLVGINPFEHKRFDRALDFLVALRARDPRFKLAVRSAMPWEIQWLWARQDDTRALFEAQFRRIFDDPDLAVSVRFDPAGPDMEEWYRGVGTIVSSSDSEGCHTAVIEGMASGCLPVVQDWPGARSLFDPYVYGDMTGAIEAVIAFAEQGNPTAARHGLAQRVETHDVEHFTRAFMALCDPVSENRSREPAGTQHPQCAGLYFPQS